MQNRNEPRVSVILPAYNEERYIRRSVGSILGQTFADFELILLDDGSTDTTWQVIQEFDDPRIRKEQLSRMGFTKALNHGLRIARGEYIARMDADDESLPKRLERQVAFLDSNATISILGTCYFKNDAMRNERYVRRFPEDDRDIRRAMALYIPLCHGSVMFRKAVVQKIGGYNESIHDAEDLELWLRAAPYFRFANLGPPPVHIYNFDPHNSFFEKSLGRSRRVWETSKLHGRAVRLIQLPPWYYGLLGARMLYYFALPSGLKRIARKLIPGISESAPQSSALDSQPGAREQIGQ